MGILSSCLDCLGPTQPFLVYLDVWEGEAGLRENDGSICIRCLEIRIDRSLDPGDFFPYPLTVTSLDSTLISRIGAPLLKMYADGTTNCGETLYLNPALGVLYREPLYLWYTFPFGDEWAKENFVALMPGCEDDSKKVVFASIDYPESLIQPPSRSLYRDGDQIYRHGAFTCVI